MTQATTSPPLFPPGFWRRITIQSFPGQVVGGLEDDVHRFTLTLSHSNGVVDDIEITLDRYPWTSCPGAGPFLTEQLIGKRVGELAQQDPRQHCTHLYDLALLCIHRTAIGSTDETDFIQYDLTVADRVAGQTTATLLENNIIQLRWQLQGTQIIGPDEWTGKDLRTLSSWKKKLSGADSLRAITLRRAVFVSGVRAYPNVMKGTAADRAPNRAGACFTYQLPRAENALPTQQLHKDFSQSKTQPLAQFDPNTLIARDTPTP